jgi:hypothetical protein
MAIVKKAQSGVKEKKLTPQQKDRMASDVKSYFKKQASDKKNAASAKKSIERESDAKISTISSFGNKFQEMFPKQKAGGKVAKKKMQAGGVAYKKVKAPMVDPKGAYTKVQERTLGNMKKGGKMSKKK